MLAAFGSVTLYVLNAPVGGASVAVPEVAFLKPILPTEEPAVPRRREVVLGIITEPVPLGVKVMLWFVPMAVSAILPAAAKLACATPAVRILNGTAASKEIYAELANWPVALALPHPKEAMAVPLSFRAVYSL